MRGLILGAALSVVAAPALAAEFMLASTEVKSGSPMGLAQVFTACKGQNISPALAERCTRTIRKSPVIA